MKLDKYNCRHEYEQEQAELAELQAHEDGLCNQVTCLYCIEERPCPWCGISGGDPVRVEERDPAVGYEVISERCSLCVNK
jgi:hypothetical protein